MGGLPKIVKDPIFIGLLFFSVVVVILLLVSIFSTSDTSSVDLEELYQMFEGINQNEDYMDFTISLNGCRIKGEFKGDHYREVVSTGEHELCERFNVTLGTDPDKFTDQIVKRDIIDRINRLQNKKKCNEMIGENACKKIPKCGWVGTNQNGRCLNRKDIQLSLDCTKIRPKTECETHGHCRWSDNKCSNI